MSMVEKETKVVNENKMTVNMTKEALYDFLLFHAYSKFSGFLVNILGLAIVFMGNLLVYNRKSKWHRGSTLSCCGSTVPRRYAIQLKMRAKKQVVINREYNAPVEYTFSEKAITIEQNGESKTYAVGSYRKCGSYTKDNWNLLCTGMCNYTSKTGFRRSVCTDFYHYCNTVWTE